MPTLCCHVWRPHNTERNTNPCKLSRKKKLYLRVCAGVLFVSTHLLYCLFSMFLFCSFYFSFCYVYWNITQKETFKPLAVWFLVTNGFLKGFVWEFLLVLSGNELICGELEESYSLQARVKTLSDWKHCLPFVSSSLSFQHNSIVHTIVQLYHNWHTIELNCTQLYDCDTIVQLYATTTTHCIQ